MLQVRHDGWIDRKVASKFDPCQAELHAPSRLCAAACAFAGATHVHVVVACMLSVRESVSVRVHQMSNMCMLSVRSPTRSPWRRQFGGGALACLSAHHQPQLQRCQHTRTETLLFDLCRASHVSAAHFDWQRLERMDGGAQR